MMPKAKPVKHNGNKEIKSIINNQVWTFNQGWGLRRIMHATSSLLSVEFVAYLFTSFLSSLKRNLDCEKGRYIIAQYFFAFYRRFRRLCHLSNNKISVKWKLWFLCLSFSVELGGGRWNGYDEAPSHPTGVFVCRGTRNVQRSWPNFPIYPIEQGEWEVQGNRKTPGTVTNSGRRSRGEEVLYFVPQKHARSTPWDDDDRTIREKKIQCDRRTGLSELILLMIEKAERIIIVRFF